MMGVTIAWGNKAHTVILLTYIDPFTLQDSLDQFEVFGEMLESVADPVVLFIDGRKGQKPPKDLTRSMWRLSKTLSLLNHPKLDQIIVVTPGRRSKMFSSIFSGVFVEMKMVNTVEQARLLLGDREVGIE